MTVRHPSRIALAILDFLTVDNPALRGDLIEEFHAGRSSTWLWLQIAGVALLHSPLRTLALVTPSTNRVLEIILVALVSFEVVFVINVLYFLFFGPPIPNFGGYLSTLHHYEPIDAMGRPAPLYVWISACAMALVVALPVGWMMGKLLNDYRRWLVAVVVSSVLLWALLIVPLPFVVQFVSMFTLTGSLVIGGRIGARVTEPVPGAR